MEYLVIDTESCTGRSTDGSLCSIGYAICDEKLNIIEQKDLLFNPIPKRFAVGDKKHAKRTGVTFAYEVEDFRKAPKFKECYEEVKQLFTDRLVIGFSMANDVKYINDACDKYKLPRISFEFIDVQYVYQQIHPETNSVGLKTLCERYDLKYREHRSDDDAAASVMLLNAFLIEEGLTLSETIDKFGVHYGINSENGYYMPFSDALIHEEFGLTRSRKIQSLLYTEYVRRLPKYKNREKVCFSYAVEKLNVNYTRTLIELILKQGYTFTRDADQCDYFVYLSPEENDKRREALKLIKKRKITQLPVAELEKKLGYEKNMSFYDDDENFLKDFYMTKIK